MDPLFPSCRPPHYTGLTELFVQPKPPAQVWAVWMLWDQQKWAQAWEFPFWKTTREARESLSGQGALVGSSAPANITSGLTTCGHNEFLGTDTQFQLNLELSKSFCCERKLLWLIYFLQVGSIAPQVWLHGLQVSEAITSGNQSAYYVYFENTLFSSGQTSLKLVLEFRCYVLCHLKVICQESFISFRHFYFFQGSLNSKLPLYVLWTESQPSTGAIFPWMSLQSAKDEGLVPGFFVLFWSKTSYQVRT